MKNIYLSIAAGIMLSAPMMTAQDLVIVHFNDTHSHVEPLRDCTSDGGEGGVIERAAFVDSVRTAQGKGKVLLLHAGDFSQGTSYFTRLNGNIEIDLINAMKYDAITIGNHEFDNGIEELARRLKHVKCPVVCANYDFSSFELGKYIKPYTIIHRGGMKIGIFGLLTDITKVVAHDIAVRIPKLGDFESATKWADYLKNEKHCDMVIALTHIGYKGGGFSDTALAAGTRNIDLIVGGHSHTFLKEIKYVDNLDGKPVPIVQDGCWGLNAGYLEVYRNEP